MLLSQPIRISQFTAKQITMGTNIWLNKVGFCEKDCFTGNVIAEYGLAYM